MKQVNTSYWGSLQRCLLLIVFINVLLIFSGCKKVLGIEELTLTGTVTDDITGVPITGGGYITVDGYNGNAVGLLAVDRKSDIGTGRVNADGSFRVTFRKWDPATTYVFYFGYPNNAYIHNGNVYLNTLLLSSALFSNGFYNTNITAAKLTQLQINFRNITPVNAEDSLRIIFPDNNVHFYYLFPMWENLQNCTVVSGSIKGGLNASGTLKCNVPSDRKFKLKWVTRKNSVINNYSDSLFCPRNITTTYSLNY